MTTPRERTLAVLQARKFLRQLGARTDVPEDVRREADRLLRHYPGSVHIGYAAVSWPMHFGHEHPEHEPPTPSYLQLLAHVRGEGQLDVAGAVASMSDEDVRRLLLGN
jgi:hypothetical protein